MVAALHLAAFVSAFAHEIACVFWVHESDRLRAGRAALWSMFCGSVGVVGLWLSIDDIRHAPALILGYGAGTFIGIRVKAGLK